MVSYNVDFYPKFKHFVMRENHTKATEFDLVKSKLEYTCTCIYVCMHVYVGVYLIIFSFFSLSFLEVQIFCAYPADK